MRNILATFTKMWIVETSHQLQTTYRIETFTELPKNLTLLLVGISFESAHNTSRARDIQPVT